MASAYRPKYSFKVIVIGDNGVGKTALLRSAVGRLCSEDVTVTIGVEMHYQNVDVGDYFVRLYIWDTAGQERFCAITGPIYRGSHAVILMYSVTDISSFNSLEFWMERIKRICPKDVKVFLVGGKADLEDQRRVMPYDVSRFAKRHQLDSINTSARTNLHVTDLFQRIASTLAIEQETKSDSQTEETAGSATVPLGNSSEPQSETKSKRKCC